MRTVQCKPLYATYKKSPVYSWYYDEYHRDWRTLTREVKRMVFPDSLAEFQELKCNPGSLIEDRSETVNVSFPTSKDFGSFEIYGNIEKEQAIALPAGIYRLPDAGGYSGSSGLAPTYFRDSSYYDLGSKASSQLRSMINAFQNDEKHPGTMRKVNALLYGPPGNGKTAMIEREARGWVEAGGIVVWMGGKDKYVDTFKHSLKGRDIMIIVEEVTNIMAKGPDGSPEAPSWLLSLLDGQDSLDNSMIFVTTNYPECLPLNMVDRVGRFQELIEVPNPNSKEIEDYLKAKDVDPSMISKIVDKCSGYNFDFLVGLTNKVLKGFNLEEVYKKFATHNKLAESNFQKRVRIGIGNRD